MKIHVLQHVPFEGLSYLQEWARGKGEITKTCFFEKGLLPSLSDINILFIMGGLMNIYEEERYPWLVQEKNFISEAICAGIPCVGICFGAQLLSHCLGGKITSNQYKEIGWHSIRLTGAGKNSPLTQALPDEMTVFHWHGDTFSIPDSAVRLCENDTTQNQAFSYTKNGAKVLGLQFHVEYTSESINDMLKYCKDEMKASPFIQPVDEIIRHKDNLKHTKAYLNTIMNNIEKEWF